MYSLQLYYVGVHVGAALVDDELDGLSLSMTWRVEPPKTLRKSTKGRRDVLAALLREDPSSLKRCHPYCWIGSKIPLRLSRVALRPELVQAVNQVVSKGFAHLDVLKDVHDLTSEIKSVIFLNGNRVDCRMSNLREVI